MGDRTIPDSGKCPAERAQIVAGWERYHSLGQRLGGYPVSSFIEAHLAGLEMHEPVVLEIGCGDGRSYSHLARKIGWLGQGRAFYVGLDSSPSAIRAAGRRPGLDSLLSDMFCLPFRSSSFGLVYTRNVLQGYSTDAVARLAGEAARVLRPGGFLAMDEMGSLHRRSSGRRAPSGISGEEAVLEAFRPLQLVRRSEEVRQRNTRGGALTTHAISALFKKPCDSKPRSSVATAASQCLNTSTSIEFQGR